MRTVRSIVRTVSLLCQLDVHIIEQSPGSEQERNPAYSTRWRSSMVWHEFAYCKEMKDLVVDRDGCKYCQEGEA